MRNAFTHGEMQYKIRFSAYAGQFAATWMMGIESMSALDIVMSSHFDSDALSGYTLSHYDYVTHNQWVAYPQKGTVLTDDSTGVRYCVDAAASLDTPLFKYDGYESVYLGSDNVTVTYMYDDVGGLVSTDSSGYTGDLNAISDSLKIRSDDGTVLTHAYHCDQLKLVGWPKVGEVDHLESFLGRGFSAGENYPLPNSFIGGSVHLFNPYISWHNWGNNGKGGFKFPMNRHESTTVHNADGTTATADMGPWMDFKLVRTNASITMYLDGREIINRSPADFASSDEYDVLFNAPMNMIANVAIGSWAYSLRDTELAETHSAMEAGAYRIEITDVTIRSDEPIETGTSAMLKML